MKKLIILIVLGVLVMGGCVAGDYRRMRENYVAQHPEMNYAVKQNIIKGYPSLGMTMEQVQVCVGGPHRRSSTNTRHGYCDVWYYGTTHGRYGYFRPSFAYYFSNGILVMTHYR